MRAFSKPGIVLTYGPGAREVGTRAGTIPPPPQKSCSLASGVWWVIATAPSPLCCLQSFKEEWNLSCTERCIYLSTYLTLTAFVCLPHVPTVCHMSKGHPE